MTFIMAFSGTARSAPPWFTIFLWSVSPRLRSIAKRAQAHRDRLTRRPSGPCRVYIIKRALQDYSRWSWGHCFSCALLGENGCAHEGMGIMIKACTCIWIGEITIIRHRHRRLDSFRTYWFSFPVCLRIRLRNDSCLGCMTLGKRWFIAFYWGIRGPRGGASLLAWEKREPLPVFRLGLWIRVALTWMASNMWMSWPCPWLPFQ